MCTVGTVNPRSICTLLGLTRKSEKERNIILYWGMRLGDDYMPKPATNKWVICKRKGGKMSCCLLELLQFMEIPRTHKEILSLSHPICSRRKLACADLHVESTVIIILLQSLLQKHSTSFPKKVHNTTFNHHLYKHRNSMECLQVQSGLYPVLTKAMVATRIIGLCQV